MFRRSRFLSYPYVLYSLLSKFSCSALPRQRGSGDSGAGERRTTGGHKNISETQLTMFPIKTGTSGGPVPRGRQVAGTADFPCYRKNWRTPSRVPRLYAVGTDSVKIRP